MNIKKFAVAAAALMIAASSQAAPVDVTYTVTGSSGDWTIDFSVTNNLTGTTQSLYFFGVELDARDIVGSPGTFNPDSWTSWGYNSYYGGSSTVYNNVWIGGSISVGETLSGFEVHSSATTLPTDIDWFAFGVGSDYTGGGSFNSGWNPGFEGVATSAVPEPANVALLLAGLGAMGLAAKRRRNAS